MRLLRITTADAPQVLRFMRQHYPPAYGHIWEDHGDWYLDSQYRADALVPVLAKADIYAYWILEVDRILGWTQWEAQARPNSTLTGAYLHRLYLATDAQGQGVGAFALRKFEAFAKSEELEYGWLEAMANGGAIRFYRREGYATESAYTLSFERMYKPERDICILYKQFSW